ncbi:HNH endonuclease [Photobacterium profundum]|uniref:HNH domain-containing protein n=1 Tax=Photobacterium profundum 3TCK TaxID=314280 RepID=Q1YWU8_9GAMM|nr:HNH endonuclease [Photobacterium profundum]EAS40754.1 hypothetical protein P3TCK_08708 [Photobacterium profundum 3TCK]
MKITDESVHRIYELSKQVYNSELSAKHAIDLVEEEKLMAAGSARIYISIFKCLMSGVAHKRAMNEYSTEYFLEAIYTDYGHEQFLVALRSTALHVTYYNSLNKGRRTSISKIIERLSKKYRLDVELFSIYPDEIDEKSFPEGMAKKVVINSFERNKTARNSCIEEYGLSCSVCEFNFEKAYGELGTGFIHVHHVVDISSIGYAYQVDPKKDLVPVCPNCHAMLHKRKPAFTVQELKAHLTRTSS